MPIETLLLAAPFTLAAAVIAGLFGLLIGSFLNVVIYRIPKMMQRESDNYVASERGEPEPHTERFNLMVPRSACPHCGHQITALENIPVLSYLVLRGKCSQCKAPISARYPAIEALTGLMSAAVVWQIGAGWIGLGCLVFTWLLIALTFIDFDTQLLPDDLTYPLVWLGLLINLNGGFTPLRSALIGAVAGYMALWTINALYQLVKKQPGMGNGDFKLLAALGALLGWTMLPTIILLSSVVGAVVGITMILFFKHKREVPIPFGPYLAGAGFIAMLFGPQLARLTQGLLGQV
jgi:leader peptidase (prepilin peptidase)/N-methyltransferase